MIENKNLNLLYYNLFPENREIIVDAAAKINLKISCSGNINDVMCIADADKVNVLFIDYDESSNVIDLISSIHKHNENLPIYLITNTDIHKDKILLYNAGIVDYIVLPMSSSMWHTVLERMTCLCHLQFILRNKKNFLNLNWKDYPSALLKKKELELLHLLNKIAECKDNKTAYHTLRVGKYAAAIVESLGGTCEDKELMLYSAPLHDIGKIAIPYDILTKTTQLTEEEYEIIKTHTIKGYEILSGTQSRFLETGALIALCHHERYDGSGYPKGLQKENIPLYARIVAIADVFDALISERSYKKAWPIKQAEEYLKKFSGILFDPSIVEIFLKREDHITTIHEEFGYDK